MWEYFEVNAGPVARKKNVVVAKLTTCSFQDKIYFIDAPKGVKLALISNLGTIF